MIHVALGVALGIIIAVAVLRHFEVIVSMVWKVATGAIALVVLIALVVWAFESPDDFFAWVIMLAVIVAMFLAGAYLTRFGFTSEDAMAYLVFLPALISICCVLAFAATEEAFEGYGYWAVSAVVALGAALMAWSFRKRYAVHKRAQQAAEPATPP